MAGKKSGTSGVYVNKRDRMFDRYKVPKSAKHQECPYSQWKEYYIADHQPNLSENIVDEPMESPLTGEMEFVKVNLLTVLSFGEISEYLSNRIRTEITKADLTGTNPKSGLRKLVLEEISLGDKAVISKVFRSGGNEDEPAPDTWWAEQGMS